MKKLNMSQTIKIIIYIYIYIFKWKRKIKMSQEREVFTNNEIYLLVNKNMFLP